MRKDPTEFRERFAKWKAGNKVYEAGLPKYEDGKNKYDVFAEQLGPLVYLQLLLKLNIKDIDKAHDYMMRQLAMESDYGNSSVARKQHNYGGYGWNGKTYTTFKDDLSFVKAYVDLMTSRYIDAVNADTIQLYGYHLKRKGYHETPEQVYTSRLAGMKSMSGAVAKHKATNQDLYSLQLPTLSKVPYRNDDYNYYRANLLGYVPDETGHMPTRDDKTGVYLKSATHPTIMKSVVADKAEGYEPYYNTQYKSMASKPNPIKQWAAEQLSKMANIKIPFLPGYEDGKTAFRYTYAGKDNKPIRITNDEMGHAFQNMVFMPKSRGGNMTKQRYEHSFPREIKHEPGLELVSPEFDVISAVRGVTSILLPKIPKSLTFDEAIKLSDSQWDDLYFQAIRRGNMSEAQKLRDLHFKVKTPNNRAVDVTGNPKKQYHTVGDEYDPSFNEFKKDIEGFDSNVYTTDNKFMSGTYSSRLLSSDELDHIIESTRKMHLSSLKAYTNPSDFIKKQISIYSDPKKARKLILKDHEWLNGPIESNRQKQLYSYLKNPVEIDAEGRDWAHIPLNNLPEDVFKNISVDLRGGIGNWYSTRSVENAIRELDYDGAIIKRVLDYGGRKQYFGPEIMNSPGTVFSIKNPKNIKLADAITYDDAGKIIPLSKRDNFNIKDIRYALPWGLFGAGYYNKYAE